jgi:hypothetical protein
MSLATLACIALTDGSSFAWNAVSTSLSAAIPRIRDERCSAHSNG